MLMIDEVEPYLGYDVELQWEHMDLTCVVVMRHVGFRCGYVGIERGHPLYGIDRKTYVRILGCSPASYIKSHWEISYSDGGPASLYPIPSNKWWFGYDCVHAWDGRVIEEIRDPLFRQVEAFIMDHMQRMTNSNIQPRSLQYCVEICEQMAEQLATIKG